MTNTSLHWRWCWARICQWCSEACDRSFWGFLMILDVEPRLWTKRKNGFHIGVEYFHHHTEMSRDLQTGVSMYKEVCGFLHRASRSSSGQLVVVTTLVTRFKAQLLLHLMSAYCQWQRSSSLLFCFECVHFQLNYRNFEWAEVVSCVSCFLIKQD